MEPAERHEHAAEVWESTMLTRAPERNTPFREATLDFIAGRVWSRPGLARRDRRWISLTCASIAGVELAIRAHVRAALDSGDITAEELAEFVVHFAAYGGWPHAGLVDSIIREHRASTESKSDPAG